MTLKERLQDDMKQAMKARESEKLTAIRMLTAAIKNKEIEVGHPLADDEITDVLASDVKKRKDAVEQFRAANRGDLVEQEERQIGFLMAYLPQQLDEAAVKAIVDAAVVESGATSMKEMGAVMKLVMPKTKGKADGGLVNRLVKERLS
ncbi:MAG: GatB/YqeY domain-containing protein [Nitrospinae bacterium]|nr:GatB/YqeY domain-containing protein [Nitrospinota bacterium]